ncbi:response regulator [Christensenellaceae bacterium OttesenSCG-928-K19]|nr:response regulator [Christensenellaceae bacterium OttesenSCG-928-K19]
MNIIAVDDERPALRCLAKAIEDAVPNETLTCFSVAKEALDYAKGATVDIAFLDIKMFDMSGLELALQLKQINPATNIIFVTAYSDYMGNALSMHVSGYIMKPATKEAVQTELENLRHPPKPITPPKRVRMKCFGAFEVFIDGEPFVLNRSRSKELLAYLVDRRGEGVSIAEIGSVLWEEQSYTRSLQKQVQTVVSLLMKALREAGIDDIIIKRRNYIALDVSKVECDYYDFLNGDTTSLNSFFCEYMSNYSWAEITTAQLFYMRLQEK